MGFVLALAVSCFCRVSLWRSLCQGGAARRRRIRVGQGGLCAATAPLWGGASPSYTSLGIIRAQDDHGEDAAWEEWQSQPGQERAHTRRPETPPPAYSELTHHHL